MKKYQTTARLIGAAALSLVMTIGFAAPSQGSTPPTPVRDLVEVATAHGTAGWASDAYLKAHPDFLPSVQMTATRVDKSASPCNGNVCEDVQGTGTTVVKWTTSAVGGNGVCTHSIFDVYDNRSPRNIDWTKSGPTICSGAGSGVFYDRGTNPAGYWPNGYMLCNGWIKIAGYPHVIIRA